MAGERFACPSENETLLQAARGLRRGRFAMLTILLRPIADWLAFHNTYAALRRLDPHLRADLGLEEADLRRLSRKAISHKGPISIYRLADEDFAAPNGLKPFDRDEPHALVEPDGVAVVGADFKVEMGKAAVAIGAEGGEEQSLADAAAAPGGEDDEVLEKARVPAMGNAHLATLGLGHKDHLGLEFAIGAGRRPPLGKGWAIIGAVAGEHESVHGAGHGVGEGNQ